MRPPEYPKNGGSVEKTVREIIDYVRATTITGATGALLKQSRRGTTLAVPKPQVLPRTSTEASANHPFHLSVSKVDSLYYWSVSSVGSTITNGTNGASIYFRQVYRSTGNRHITSPWINNDQRRRLPRRGRYVRNSSGTRHNPVSDRESERGG